MDRAGELYSSMQLRGFCGEFWYAGVKPAKAKDYVFAFSALMTFALCRYFNIATIFGSMALGGAT